MFSLLIVHVLFLTFLSVISVHLADCICEKRILAMTNFDEVSFLFPEPAAECPTSPESLKDRMYFLDTEEKEKEDLCVGSLPQQRTNIREPQNRMKLEDKPHRLKPPD